MKLKIVTSLFLLYVLMLLCSCQSLTKHPNIQDTSMLEKLSPSEKKDSKVDLVDKIASSNFLKDKESDEENRNSNVNGQLSKLSTSNSVLEKISSKIIKTGSLTMEVKNYKKDIIAIREFSKKHQGYVSSENEINNEYSLQNTIVIRVPSDAFDALLFDVEQTAFKVDSKNVSVQDVTADYLDQSMRLKTKKEVELRYLSVLRQANSIGEILSVESELRVIQEEIESAEGQLKFLDDQVGYSTLTIETHQTNYKATKNGFFNDVLEGVKTGWNIMLSFIIGFFTIWPFFMLLSIILLVIRRIVKKRKTK